MVFPESLCHRCVHLRTITSGLTDGTYCQWASLQYSPALPMQPAGK